MWTHLEVGGASSAVVALFVMALWGVTDEATPYLEFNTTTELVHWSFNGTLSDVSQAHGGNAVAEGVHAELAWDESSSAGYARIREPGYFNLPRVDIHAISFTFSFFVRFPSPSSGRQILYADWSSGQWQFMSVLRQDNRIDVILRRNIPTAGSDLEQDLMSVTSSEPVLFDKWFGVAFTFDRPMRRGTLYFDTRQVGSVLVRESVKDVTLMNSQSQFYQFGNKQDEHTLYLNADVRDLRVFASSQPWCSDSVPQPAPAGSPKRSLPTSALGAIAAAVFVIVTLSAALLKWCLN